MREAFLGDRGQAGGKSIKPVAAHMFRLLGAESGQLLPDGNLVVEIGEIREEKNLSPLPGVDAFGYVFCGLHWFLFCHKKMQLCDICK